VNHQHDREGRIAQTTFNRADGPVVERNSYDDQGRLMRVVIETADGTSVRELSYRQGRLKVDTSMPKAV
jgi:hypothetical protein